MSVCKKPYEKSETPYSQGDNPYSRKESSYARKNTPLEKKDTPYSELCLNFEIKVFQDSTPFVFQNGYQYAFND
jgi:hypothetical protein